MGSRCTKPLAGPERGIPPPRFPNPHHPKHLSTLPVYYHNPGTPSQHAKRALDRSRRELLKRCIRSLQSAVQPVIDLSKATCGVYTFPVSPYTAWSLRCSREYLVGVVGGGGSTMLKRCLDANIWVTEKPGVEDACDARMNYRVRTRKGPV